MRKVLYTGSSQRLLLCKALGATNEPSRRSRPCASTCKIRFSRAASSQPHGLPQAPGTGPDGHVDECAARVTTGDFCDTPTSRDPPFFGANATEHLSLEAAHGLLAAASSCGSRAKVHPVMNLESTLRSVTKLVFTSKNNRARRRAKAHETATGVQFTQFAAEAHALASLHPHRRQMATALHR